ncbi:unnamed protein product, partial [Coregonus sp. 'balchen']
KMLHHPEILTLQLKRFEFDDHSMSYVKKDCCVDIPHTLQTKNCDYELYAVVDHVGSLRGGHYTATIKSHDDHNWYVFDDTKVRQVVCGSQSAYLLMYNKWHVQRHGQSVLTSYPWQSDLCDPRLSSDDHSP